VCVDGIASHTCDCAIGFSGEFCEVNVDDCASSPCLNGGTCVDLVNDYTCQCPEGFTGLDCETKVTIEVATLTTVTMQTGENIHRYFYSTCWGNKLWLKLLLKQNGFSSWMKSLFDKKDNEAWLKNLLSKNYIDEEQSVQLGSLLSEHAMEAESDETARWWKNLSEENWNGCVPYWSKLACKKELEDRIPTEGPIEDVLEQLPPLVSAPTTTAAPVAQEPALLGCYIDQEGSARDLAHGPGRRKFFNQGEEQKCFDECKSQGYKYAGLQWHGECWCDNTYGAYGLATEDSNTQCDCRMGADKHSFWGNCVYDMNA
jgi:hypothetical protein